jgi:hypothetical protein
MLAGQLFVDREFGGGVTVGAPSLSVQAAIQATITPTLEVGIK